MDGNIAGNNMGDGEDFQAITFFPQGTVMDSKKLLNQAYVLYLVPESS